MFPGILKLQLEQKTNMDLNANQDHLRLSNIYSHLSLTSILRNRQSAFSLERYVFVEPIKCQCCPHIETSQLICCAHQLTGFYMRETLTFNGLM